MSIKRVYSKKFFERNQTNPSNVDNIESEYDNDYLKLLRKLGRMAEANKTIDIPDLNREILELFPKPPFLKGRAKKAQIYFLKLVPYMFSVLKKSKLEEVLKLLKVILYNLYGSNNTLDNRFTGLVHNPVKKRYGQFSEEHKLSLSLAKLDGKDKAEVIEKAKVSLKKAQGEIVRFDPNLIHKIIQNGMVSNNVYEKTIALLLASGCRPIELLNEKIHFVALDKNWVNQDFLAKKRGNIVPVDKPLIGVSPNDFIDGVGDVRHELSVNGSCLKDGKLITGIVGPLNQKAKKLLVGIKGATTYSCRKIYAELSYEMFAKNSRYGKDPTRTLWRSRVLGHGEDDLATQIFYNNYKSIHVAGEDSGKVKALEAEVNALQKKVAQSSNSSDPFIDTKEAKKLEYYAVVKETYEKQSTKPGQTELERLLAGKVPRSHIRAWFKGKQ